MKRAFLGLFALISGCVTPRLADFENGCAGEPFANYGSCLESSLQTNYPQWRNDNHGDLVQIYIAWLNAAGKRVDRGAMDESEARLGAVTLKARLAEVAQQRSMNAMISRQAAMAQMLSGLALIEASRPVVQQPSIAMPITCTQYRTNSVTGQTQTICQ